MTLSFRLVDLEHFWLYGAGVWFTILPVWTMWLMTGFYGPIYKVGKKTGPFFSKYVNPVYDDLGRR